METKDKAKGFATQRAEKSQSARSSWRLDHEAIVVLDLREAVRLRPSMYIGSTGELGLHNMVYQVLSNSVSEHIAGHCNRIELTIHRDDSITISDNGRGLPVEVFPRDRRPRAEVLMTTLFCGYPMDAPGALLAPINFLSESLRLKICRDGRIYRQEYLRGAAQGPLQLDGETKRHGTKISFKPDPEIFQVLDFDFAKLCHWLRILAFLNPRLTLTITDERSDHSREFFHRDGIPGFVREINNRNVIVTDAPLYFEKAATSEDELKIEFALQYNTGRGSIVHSFANQVETIDGGKHLDGFIAGIIRAVNRYARFAGLAGLFDSRHMSLSWQDVRAGLVAIISIVLPNPWLSGPTRSKLESDVKDAVAAFVDESMTQYLKDNPAIARKIVNKVLQASKCGEAAESSDLT